MATIRPVQYKEIPSWNVDTVLQNIASWGENITMDMEKLTLKLSMLFSLASAARCNELADLKTNLAFRNKDGIRFKLTKHKKQRKSTQYPGYLDIPSYPDNILMCPVSCYDWYLVKTAGYRVFNEDDDFVFRALSHPHGKITPSTISRWLRKAISEAGFDLTVADVAHSVRGIAATKAKASGMSIRQIMTAVEWNTNSVFHQHYYNQKFDPTFGREVLKY